MTWYRLVDGTPSAPLTEDDLRRLAREGMLSAADLVWRQGMAEWTPASLVPGLLPAPPMTSPPPPPTPGPPPLPAGPMPATMPKRQPFVAPGPTQRSLVNALTGLAALDVAHLGAALLFHASASDGVGNSSFEIALLLFRILPLAWIVLVVLTVRALLRWLRVILANARAAAGERPPAALDPSVASTDLLRRAVVTLQEAWRLSAKPGAPVDPSSVFRWWTWITILGLVAGLTGRGFGQVLGLLGWHASTGVAGVAGAFVPHGLSLASALLAMAFVRQLSARQVAWQAADARARAASLRASRTGASASPAEGSRPPHEPPWHEASQHAELRRSVNRFAIMGAGFSALVFVAVFMRGGNPLLLPHVPGIPFPLLVELGLPVALAWGVWKHRSRACACILFVLMTAMLVSIVVAIIAATADERAGRRRFPFSALVFLILAPMFQGVRAVFKEREIARTRPGA